MLSRRFLSVFLFVLFSVCLFGSETFANADRCPRHQVKTELKAKRLKTVFKRASVVDINGYLNSHGVLAFVSNPLDISTQFDFSTKKMGNGRYCVILNKVKTFYISKPRIVMPSNFRRNSCEYELILKHEKRHLQVHYDYYDHSVGKYKSFLGRIARNVPVLNSVKTEAGLVTAQNHIKNYFAEKFYEQVGRSLGEMQRLQSKIDSPQEYTFTGKKIERCEIQRGLKNKKNKKSFHDHSL